MAALSYRGEDHARLTESDAPPIFECLLGKVGQRDGGPDVQSSSQVGRHVSGTLVSGRCGFSGSD